ncbi:hypothetical protein FN846DRAFT_890361 [Sphaerosporella brunnea]|uniref:Uncharacterized protein n=1 Tax=Sphaerosporella brunnea TaxID=1250544 RepID=A0A5J5EWN7_9PEZI|nr:hypothetical protein FN846DRAFT_890361 [Sphaerosporella brunnea]
MARLRTTPCPSDEQQQRACLQPPAGRELTIADTWQATARTDTATGEANPQPARRVTRSQTIEPPAGPVARGNGKARGGKKPAEDVRWCPELMESGSTVSRPAEQNTEPPQRRGPGKTPRQKAIQEEASPDEEVQGVTKPMKNVAIRHKDTGKGKGKTAQQPVGRILFLGDREPRRSLRSQSVSQSDTSMVSLAGSGSKYTITPPKDRSQKKGGVSGKGKHRVIVKSEVEEESDDAMFLSSEIMSAGEDEQYIDQRDDDCEDHEEYLDAPTTGGDLSMATEEDESGDEGCTEESIIMDGESRESTEEAPDVPASRGVPIDSISMDVTSTPRGTHSLVTMKLGHRRPIPHMRLTLDFPESE